MCAYFSSLPARVSRSSSKTDARRFSVRARCITFFLLKTSLPSNDEEKDETDKKRKRKEKEHIIRAVEFFTIPWKLFV